MAAALFEPASLVDRSGNSYPAVSLDADVIGIYFSAHWCPPCRAFTPTLADWYETTKAKVAAAQGALPSVEVVFVSWDESEPEFAGYLASMPFKAVDFKARATKDALSAKFGVRGIPTLVFVSRDGTVLTTAGRPLVANTGSEYPWTLFKSEGGEADSSAGSPGVYPWDLLKAQQPAPSAAPVAPAAGPAAAPEAATASAAAALFGSSSLVDRKGGRIPSRSVTADVVGIYFSAHWCPPCRGFTPVLAKWYESTQAEILAARGALPSLEVVFVSWDESEPEFAGYLASMPFKAVDFKEKATKDALSAKFGVRSIPTLVFVRRDGTVMTTAGRTLVASEGAGYPWTKRIAEEAAAGPASSGSAAAASPWGFYALLAVCIAVLFSLLGRSAQPK